MFLTKDEKNRIVIMQALIEGKIDVEDASTLLALSKRQIYRLFTKAQDGDLSSVLHGNKGQAAINKIPESVWNAVLSLVKDRYTGINDLHLQEILKRNHQIEVGRESLRKRLRQAGLAPKRRHRKKKYHQRRERKPAFGMMLQIDASDHDWLEGRGGRLTLVGARDDATNYCWCRFEDEETTWAYIRLMRTIFVSHGLPLSLYSDKHTIFHSPRQPTITEQLNDRRPLTQFGRAMKELGVNVLKAHSPQAKGRIERLWEFFQDRLVVELRLEGIKSKEDANSFLTSFLKRINRGFSVKPKQAESVFRRAPRAGELDRILCLKETRVVNSDHTISYEGLILQLPRLSKYASIAKQRVEVLQLRDGSVEVIYKDQVALRLTSSKIQRLINNMS